MTGVARSTTSFVITVALAVGLTPAVGVQQAFAQSNDCSSEDLSDTAADGPADRRVTVKYDAHNLVDPAVDPGGARATQIAEAVAEEAVEALNVYGAFGFADAISPTITIELKCRTLTGRANVLGPNLVEFPVALIRNELAAQPGQPDPLTGDEWRTGNFRWADVLHHEMFHAIQYGLKAGLLENVDFWREYFFASASSLFESGATLAQDLFGPDLHMGTVVVDDQGDSNVSGDAAGRL
jgi:hypothetical protein